MSGAPLGSQFATFDASGRAVVSLGPTVYGSKWNVDRMVVTTQSSAVTKCFVYRNVEQATALTDSTKTGNADTSETDIDLTPPDKLLFVWSGGTPGAIATAIVSGTLDTGRN